MFIDVPQSNGLQYHSGAEGINMGTRFMATKEARNAGDAFHGSFEAPILQPIKDTMVKAKVTDCQGVQVIDVVHAGHYSHLPDPGEHGARLQEQVCQGGSASTRKRRMNPAAQGKLAKTCQDNLYCPTVGRKFLKIGL